LGNYRQHLTFAAGCGSVYTLLAYLSAGVHWVYGSVALLLTTFSGLLPDLDSPSGVEVKGLSSLLGCLTALSVWKSFAGLQPVPAFEYHLWAMIAAYLLVRHGLRRLFIRFSVHRGISHSVPTGAVWGAVTYLYYPSEYPIIRLTMACAVMTGFGSHLLLDEMCSVNLKNVRVNKAFGTAIKFWAPSALSTIGIYALLSVLTWQIAQQWPADRLAFAPPPPPAFPVQVVRELQLPRDLEKSVVDSIEGRLDLQLPDNVSQNLPPVLKHPPRSRRRATP
jgi:LexA-binding, inner membrane-associated putative hydrolase